MLSKFLSDKIKRASIDYHRSQVGTTFARIESVERLSYGKLVGISNHREEEIIPASLELGFILYGVFRYDVIKKVKKYTWREELSDETVEVAVLVFGLDYPDIIVQMEMHLKMVEHLVLITKPQ